MPTLTVKDAIAKVETQSNACPSGGGGACASCRDMCAIGYPGRFTPEEAAAAMASGHGDRLMAVAFKSTVILRPAIIGWEEGDVPEPLLARGQCTFLSASGTCEIHATGYKPLECRAAVCRSTGRFATRADVNAVVAAIERAWRTKAGRALVARWRSERS